MNKYILKSGLALWFMPYELQKLPQKFPINEGFTKREADIYQLTLFCPQVLGDSKEVQFYADDLENRHESGAQPPQIAICGVVGYEGNVSRQNFDPNRVKNWQGKDIMQWAMFIQLLQHLNVNVNKLGICEPREGGPLRPCAIRVKALEGKDQFEARNALTAWAPDLEKFKIEDRMAAATLADQMAQAQQLQAALQTEAPKATGLAPLGPLISREADKPVAPPVVNLIPRPAGESEEKTDEGKADEGKASRRKSGTAA